MASLNRWIILSLLACGVLAIAYLPPRGAKSTGRLSFFVGQAPQGTPARRRAQALAEEWRRADGGVHLLTARRQLRDLDRRVGVNAGPLVVLSDSARVPVPEAHLVDSAMQTAWRQLRLGETKVRVAVVLELVPVSPPRDRPLAEEGQGTYLAPDSTDRTTCIAVLPAGRYWTRVVTGELRRGGTPFDALVQSLKAGLGPCAFYAAYGTPAQPVRHWLVARRWDLALTLDPGARGRQANSMIGMADPRFPWYWEAIYSLPPTAVACLSHRAEGCRAAVLAGANEDSAIPFPDIMRIDRRWGRRENLVEAPRFLGDVAHEVGRERFLSFWTSELPVDTALAAVLKRPVGEWTADWQATFINPIRLGPAAPLGAVGMALLLAAVAVGVVVLTASRRQVR